MSRLRRQLKDNWQREVALLAALGVIVSAIVFLVLKRDDGPEPITHDPTLADPRALEIRKTALQKCAASEWKACVDGLDEAKRLDPAGDTAPEIRRARDDAAKALTPPPEPTSSAAPPLDPTAAPSFTPPPQPKVAPTGFDSAMPPAPKPPARPKGDDMKPTSEGPSKESSLTPAPAPTPAPTAAAGEAKGVQGKPAAPTKKGSAGKVPSGSLDFGSSGSTSSGDPWAGSSK